MHRNADRVVAAAAAAGLTIEPATFPEGTRSADDAARAIGVTVDQIVKSLVFAVDGRPVLALVAGGNRLDEAKLAAAAGGAACQRVDADTVRRVTGYPVGGVPPFGHESALPTFVDTDLLIHDVVWAAAGTPHDNFAAPPAELVRVTGGRVVDIGRALSARPPDSPSLSRPARGRPRDARCRPRRRTTRSAPR